MIVLNIVDNSSDMLLKLLNSYKGDVTAVIYLSEQTFELNPAAINNCANVILYCTDATVAHLIPAALSRFNVTEVMSNSFSKTYRLLIPSGIPYYENAKPLLPTRGPGYSAAEFCIQYVLSANNLYCNDSLALTSASSGQECAAYLADVHMPAEDTAAICLRGSRYSTISETLFSVYKIYSDGFKTSRFN